ncbi:hypothetical protein CPAR01_08763 [Colletotrichum paranaense]|uniref:Uncharacterized protein n=1 Tax=Colletotrichum paranaense TaxID=1914294 RepID=A0ABQ9SM18_9PEZI|nr:uncharacterized protein CPAR01_08763 [Colletotrichum paranaense]KAK1538650.1 hypothetical protein CPAR01_08763 [Colletotrichum paranaense]
MGRAFTEHTVIEVADARWTFGVRLTYSIHLGTVAFSHPSYRGPLDAWQFSVYRHSADRGRSMRLQSPILHPQRLQPSVGEDIGGNSLNLGKI